MLIPRSGFRVPRLSEWCKCECVTQFISSDGQAARNGTPEQYTLLRPDGFREILWIVGFFWTPDSHITIDRLPVPGVAAEGSALR